MQLRRSYILYILISWNNYARRISPGVRRHCLLDSLGSQFRQFTRNRSGNHYFSGIYGYQCHL